MPDDTESPRGKKGGVYKLPGIRLREDLGGSIIVRANSREPDVREAVKAIEDILLRARESGFDVAIVKGTNDVLIIECKRAETADLRTSLANRVQRWLAGSLEQMNDEEVLRLVEAQTPAEMIVELLVATPTHTAPEDEWTDLLLRGAEAKNQIARLAGGLLSSSQAAAVLRISVPGVKQRLERGKLLAVPLPGGQRGFPALQFQQDGHVRKGVAEVAAAGAHLDPWALLAILVDEADGTEGETLLERLGDETVRADVLARLASYGEHAAA